MNFSALDYVGAEMVGDCFADAVLAMLGAVAALAVAIGGANEEEEGEEARRVRYSAVAVHAAGGR